MISDSSRRPKEVSGGSRPTWLLESIQNIPLEVKNYDLFMFFEVRAGNNHILLRKPVSDIIWTCANVFYGLDDQKSIIHLFSHKIRLKWSYFTKFYIKRND